MKSFKSLSIGVKILIISTVLAAIFLGFSFSYGIIKMRAELINSSLIRLETEVVSEKEKIETLINESKNLITFLNGTPPIQGIIRARNGGGFDEAGNSSLEQWKTRLQSIFTSEIQATGIYNQLRYIDENGQELVRVDLKNNEIFIVPEESLQNKSDREYFIEASQLENGEIYISKAELNREGSPAAISIPYQPVIRYATPVFDITTNERKGLIVANISLDNFIEKSALLFNKTSDVHLIDKEGFFMVHPDENKEWGSEKDLGTGFNFSNQFNQINLNQTQRESDSFIQNGYIYSYSKINLNEPNLSREWTIIESLPVSHITQTINNIVKGVSLVALVTFLILFFAFLYIIRYLLSPLKELAKSANEIGSGNFDTKAKVYHEDEIGKVAIVFNKMVKDLKKLYGSLESEVQKKTKDLNKKIKELKKLNRLMIGREEKMIELKKEIKKLKSKK